MSQIALFNGKNSAQEDVLFDNDSAENYARNLEVLASERKRNGYDPSVEYAKFLSMYHFPLIKKFKPGLLAAPGVITIEQQGGTTTFGSNVTFRHTQAGDFSRYSQLNFSFSDVSCTSVEYTNIAQLVSGASNTDYHLNLVVLVASPDAVAALGDVSSTFRYIIATVMVTPCGPDNRPLKMNDTVRNFVVLPEYPAEVAVMSTNVGTGSNEYIKFDMNYHIFRRELLCENRRRLYNELVGQQEYIPAISQDYNTIASRPHTFGAANSIDWLSAANSASVLAGHDTAPLTATGLVTALDKYKMRAEATANYTTVEHKFYSNGYQTP
ncbi:MAG: hypothetical protein KDH96_07300, partial [Candidatus Riesia sp.]|nr:hypothetical protein [Candidatus Riesia sp.]